jgi:cellulose synthase/poly-beta-1,6-N-acetylglucosamine synthase-like glycosyltransferase
MSKKGRTIEWGKFFGYLFFSLLVPIAVLSLLVSIFPNILKILYYFVIWIFVIQAGLSYTQTLGGFRRKLFRPLTGVQERPVPKATFLISAYLPNELEVIEKTLINILKNVERPAAGIEVMLDYNTPNFEDIEIHLKELAYKWPELILANAYHSRSKSENLNYALEIASGEMIVLLDADHIVAPDCLMRAWRWLEKGYDAVQGRCRVRNGNEGILPAIIEVEFEAMYGISHYAKSLLFDTTLFGGSNGYWRSSVIKLLGFEKNMLTEDIDITLRAILSGYKIVHDRSIISSELAPSTWGALWHQRKRWSQGWFQCALKHQKAVLYTKHLNFIQRFWWTMLLSYRVFYDFVTHLLPPVLITYWITVDQVVLPMTAFIWFALFFTVLSGPFEVVAAYKNAVKPRSSVFRYILYLIMLIPFTFFKNMISVISVWQEWRKERTWVVSER